MKQSVSAYLILGGIIYYPKGSFAITNDLWGDGEDRWRTTSAELTIGKYSIGTYVDTNWGFNESGCIKDAETAEELAVGRNLYDPAKAPVGKHINRFDIMGSYKKGNVFSAPIWFGFRQGNQILRVGYSHWQVQNLTQNLVHKFMKTSFYKGYNTIKSTPYIQVGTPNPFSLWNH